MSMIIMDLDGTLTIEGTGENYSDVLPNLAVIEKLREYRQNGFSVAIHTARNMRTHKKSIGRINAITLPQIIDWLKRYDIPYDEIHVGKPWPDEGGFYVDDRSIRPSEFLTMTHDEIMKVTNRG